MVAVSVEGEDGRDWVRGSAEDRRDRDGVAAALIHPHALAPFLRRRPRSEMDAIKNSPRQ